MKDGYIWAVVIGQGVANFALRFTPIALLSKVRLPRPVERWLSFVPVSVMAALVVSEVVRPNGVWLPPLANPYLVAAVPTALIYWRTRSFMGTTLAGIALFVTARALLG